MSVIPLIREGPNKTVVSTKDDFTAAKGFDGKVALISNLDPKQLLQSDGDSHVSYDLRVGSEYKDHRKGYIYSLRTEKDEITLLPNVAVLVVTEEAVCLPRSLFGYIVPKVKLLQAGISNTLSKIDPGYDGQLVITIFNLGRKTVTLKRGQPFCSLVLHSVSDGASLYSKPAKGIEGGPRKRRLQLFFDWLRAHNVEIATIALLWPIVLKLFTWLWTVLLKWLR